MLKRLLNTALGLIAKSDHGKKFDIHMVRVIRDPQTMYPRVEATDLKRIIRIEGNSRSEVEEFFIDHRILESLKSADRITHEKQILTATTGEECVMVETKAAAEWPNFDRVLPKKPTSHRLEVNGKLLIELLSVILAYEADPNQVVSLEIHNGDLVVKASGKEVSITAMISRIATESDLKILHKSS